jgi:hypothetical protein
MRRVLFGSLFIAVASLTGLAILWFFIGGGSDSEGAAARLTRLSRQSATLTYYARYQTEGSDGKSLDSLTVYQEPRVGFRFDLPAPLDAEDDAKQPDSVLKSGDIFILNPALPDRLISCRTARGSCRHADGLEVLAFLTFSMLFRYDQPFFEQPNTVTRNTDISAADKRRSVSLSHSA